MVKRNDAQGTCCHQCNCFHGLLSYQLHKSVSNNKFLRIGTPRVVGGYPIVNAFRSFCSRFCFAMVNKIDLEKLTILDTRSISLNENTIKESGKKDGVPFLQIRNIYENSNEYYILTEKESTMDTKSKVGKVK